MVHVGTPRAPEGLASGMTYEWTNGSAVNQGNPATGLVNTATHALTVGAPNSTARLVRTEFHFRMTLAGTATGVAITPEWPIRQYCAAVCVAQAAGSSVVPDPYASRDPDTVLYAPVETVEAGVSFSSSQGFTVLATDGLLVSKAERMTPPVGGWQVSAGFTWNDGAGFVTGFGSNFRWQWQATMACLWRL